MPRRSFVNVVCWLTDSFSPTRPTPCRYSERLLAGRSCFSIILLPSTGTCLCTCLVFLFVQMIQVSRGLGRLPFHQLWSSFCTSSGHHDENERVEEEPAVESSESVGHHDRTDVGT